MKAVSLQWISYSAKACYGFFFFLIFSENQSGEREKYEQTNHVNCAKPCPCMPLAIRPEQTQWLFNAIEIWQPFKWAVTATRAACVIVVEAAAQNNSSWWFSPSTNSIVMPLQISGAGEKWLYVVKSWMRTGFHCLLCSVFCGNVNKYD